MRMLARGEIGKVKRFSLNPMQYGRSFICCQIQHEQKGWKCCQASKHGKVPAKGAQGKDADHARPEGRRTAGRCIDSDSIMGNLIRAQAQEVELLSFSVRPRVGIVKEALGVILDKFPRSRPLLLI